mmetsp:Transcript_11906/g.20398  ORF Transcript_11906/g.20398 Transcript_11906/m.20398 type:complete len:456 (+) Transcript_11906:73-1440(+)
MTLFPSHCWPVTLLLIGVESALQMNLSRVLRRDREIATDYWRRGRGLLWFQHLRRAGGTSLCDLLHAALLVADFVEERSEACQPEEWKLRDAHAVMGHNLTLLAKELRILGGNAFAQEYGPIPAAALLARRMPHWVFVTHIRDPWSRFWSQLRHEMAPCLNSVKALAVCVDGKHEVLGMWWSLTAHLDSVLGVPDYRLAEHPHLYGDNYYTRVLLNRTDLDGPPLTLQDYEVAKSILFDRMSAVIVIEDFARSALQLACTLGLDLDTARPLLQTHVRPYQHHEGMLEIPTESELGIDDVATLQSRFAKNNRFDYGLYQEAKRLSEIQVANCAKRKPVVAELRASAAYVVKEVKQAAIPKVDVGIDALFGCVNGSVEYVDGGFVLMCPRTREQRKHSWWTPVGALKERAGQRVPGEHCWIRGFQWAFCCDESFGPEGNKDCWDETHNYSSCCTSLE